MAQVRSSAAKRTATIPILLVVAMLMPSGLGLVSEFASAAGPTAPPVRFIAHYASFASVPTDAQFAEKGYAVEYRFQAIPSVVLFGAEARQVELRLQPGFVSVEDDQPLEYFMQTATFATNAADVWGSKWWPTASEVQRKTPSPIVVDGEVIDGSGVVVGVVDSGVDGLHPDLWFQSELDGVVQWESKLLACVNIPIGEGVDEPYCDLASGHGTHVAGIVAGNAYAARNGLAPLVSATRPPIGAAPGAKMVATAAGVGLNIVFAAQSLDWMYTHAEEYNVSIVTNSWGNSPGCSAAMPSDSITSITDRLVTEKGIVVLYAASNYDNLGNPTWTSGYARNPTPGVIVVANYDDRNTGTRNGIIASSSSDGCVASGGAGDFLVTWPDVAAPGSSILSTAAATGTVIPRTNGGFYGTAGGTSMATPHVAGIVALMLQANPDLTPAQVERILIETSTQWKNDGVSARGRSGTTMWNANPDLCYVTPADAAKAEAGDASINTKFPGFTTLAQRTDADLYVCRDFKRGNGLVDAYAAVMRAIELRGDNGTQTPAVTISSPADESELAAGPVTVSGLVDRFASGAPTASLTATPSSGSAPLDVVFALGASDSDGSVASWTLDFGDATPGASGVGIPPATLAHTYATQGTRTATLTVQDDTALVATATATVTATPPPSEGRVLWLVGDGTSTVVIEADADPLGDRTFGLSPTANGDKKTTYRTQSIGNQASPNNPFNPTWTATTPVTLSGDAVQLIIDVDYAFPNQNGLITCPLSAQLFDGTTLLGARATAVVAQGLGTYRKATFTFSPPAGTYESLMVQVGAGIDCGSAPVEWAWGTSTLNGRIVLGPNDVGGGPGPIAASLDGSGDSSAPATDITSLRTTAGATRTTITMGLAAAPTARAHGYPVVYVANLNGVALGASVSDGRVLDLATGSPVNGASVAFDGERHEVRFTFPALTLNALGLGCACLVSAETRLVQPGVIGADDRVPEIAGTSSVVTLNDPEGDGVLPGTDIRQVLVHDETTDSFKVSLKIKDLDQATPSTLRALNVRFGAENTYSVGWSYAESPTNTVKYEAVATNYLYNISSSGTPSSQTTSFELRSLAAGTGTNFVSGLGGLVGVWDAENDLITWTVPKSMMDVIKSSTGQTDTTTRGGRTPVTGDNLTAFTAEVRTWVRAAAGLGPGQTIWDTGAGDNLYTFHGGNAPPLASLEATPTIGAAPLDVVFTLSASDPEGQLQGWTLDFGDATLSASGSGAPPASLSHTYAAAGSFTARLVVTDAGGASTEKTVEIGVGASAGERVTVLLDGAAAATVAVATSAQSPTAPWSAVVDLTGLTGRHTISATWFDADGETILATSSVDVVLGSGVPAVEITSPAPGENLTGTVTVTGTAGHTSLAAAEGSTVAARYDLVTLPGGETSLRATTTYDFDAGAEGWTTSNEAWTANGQNVPGSQQGTNQDPSGALGKWHRQTSYVGSGTSAWYAGSSATLSYNPGIRTNLVSPAVSLADSTAARVDFLLGGAAATGDKLLLQWKTVGAADTTYSTFAEYTQDSLDADGYPLFAAQTAALPAGALGQDVQVRFRFETQADPDVVLGFDWGYFVDRVEVVTTPTTVEAPGAPQNLAAVGGVLSATVTWLAPASDGGAAVTAYNVYRDGALVATQTATTFADAGLVADVAYSYAVSAVNAVGEGPQAGPVTATAQPEPAPSDLAITSPANGAVVYGNVTLAGTFGTGADGEPEDKARVVLAVIDSGLNVYHSYFYAGSAIYPAGSPPASVTPEVLAELGIPASRQVQLTRTGNFAADFAADAALWSQIRASAGDLWYFKGTNIVATSPGSIPGAVILPDDADDAHGTGTTASVLTANPEAIILFVEGTDATSEVVAFNNPSVDIVSTSYGPPGSVPYALNIILDYDTLQPHMTDSYKGVVLGGKLHFGAADNSPSPAIQDSSAGPWWSIGVNGFESDTGHGRQLMSGTFADFAADFTQDLPYCHNCESGGIQNVGGTSFATPMSAGTASKVLLEARRAANHEGGIVLATSAGPAMVVGAGETVTNWQLRRALEQAAVYEGIAQYDPVEGVFDSFSVPVVDAVPYASVGWGILSPSPVVVEEALRQLGGVGTRSKSADACAYMTGVHAARHAYYDMLAPMSDSWMGAADGYLHCDPAGGATSSSGFTPLKLTRSAEIVDAADETPAPPPFDILSVDVASNATHLSATFTMDMLVAVDETISPEFAGTWYDFNFETDGRYILEAAGVATNLGPGIETSLWRYNPTGGATGGGGWSRETSAGTAFKLDLANHRFTVSVELDDIGIDPAEGGLIANTWAGVWPSTYAAAYDLAPNGATSQGPFGANHTVAPVVVSPPVEPEQVTIVLDGPNGFTATGNATLDLAAKTWTFDPAGVLADGFYTASATYLQQGIVKRGPVTVSFTVDPTPDTTAPTIAGVEVVVGRTSATISWLTDEPATTTVEYGATSAYGSVASAPGFLASHQLVLPDLAPGATYHWRIVSADAAGNTAQTAGATFTLAPANRDVVDLFLDGVKVGFAFVDTTNGDAPWSIAFDTTSFDEGPWTLSAVFTDAQGANATSSRQVFVDNLPNRAPVLAPIGALTVNEGQVLTVVLDATDADRDTLAFSVASMPVNAEFVANANSFVFAPDYTQAGTYEGVVFSVSDGSLSDSETVTITVVDVPRPPVLAHVADQTVEKGANLAFGVSASDPDGGVLTLTASGLPAGASFVDNANGTGSFSWTPAPGSPAGVFTVGFHVTDPNGLTDSQDVAITVPEDNRAPTLLPIGNKTVNEGSTLTLVLSAEDPDGDALVYNASNLPAGATFTPSTRTFSYAPGYDAAGTYAGVRFEVADGEFTDSEAITIVVDHVNRAPVLAPIGPKAINENEPLTFTVGAADADGDALTYAATNLPAGAAFDAQTQTFTWQPAFGAAGNYPGVRFAVTDGSLEDAEEITITVGDVDQAPVLAPIGPQTVNEAQTLAFTVSASDPDSATLTLSATNLPPGAAFNPATGAFSWTPTHAQAGVYPTVRFEVTDGTTVVGETVVVTVVNVDRPAVVAPMANRVVYETASVNVSLSASDPDGDAIVLAATGMPVGATLVDLGNGQGWFNWTPQPGQKGNHTVTIVALSGAVSGSRTLNVSVLFKTDLAVVSDVGSAASAAPGQPLVLTATLTNTGPQQDAFRLFASNSANWALVGPGAPVMLAPGESATISVSITAPLDGSVSFVTLGAVSMGDGNVSKHVRVRVDVPVTVVVEMARNFSLIEPVGGVIRLTYLNGAPAVNATVTLVQTPRLWTNLAQSSVAGASNATGEYAFSFAGDVKASLPGDHDLVVTVRSQGSYVRIVPLVYTVR